MHGGVEEGQGQGQGLGHSTPPPPPQSKCYLATTVLYEFTRSEKEKAAETLGKIALNRPHYQVCMNHRNCAAHAIEVRKRCSYSLFFL